MNFPAGGCPPLCLQQQRKRIRNECRGNNIFLKCKQNLIKQGHKCDVGLFYYNTSYEGVEGKKSKTVEIAIVNEGTSVAGF